jgi:hypothetical protein
VGWFHPPRGRAQAAVNGNPGRVPGIFVGESSVLADLPCPKPPIDVSGSAGVEAKKKSTTLMLLPPR